MFWVRAFVYSAMRSLTIARSGLPTSHCSVGVLMLTWSIAPAIAGAIAAPKMAAPAEKKALRDCSDSAFNATLPVFREDEGANAEAVARVTRETKIENFILCVVYW